MEVDERLTPGPNDVGRTLPRAVDHVSMGAHKVIDKVSDAARPVVERIAAGAHQTVDRIAGATGQAADAIGVTSGKLRNAQVRATEQCRGYIRDYPFTTLGVAIAAGFLLSRLWSSR